MSRLPKSRDRKFYMVKRPFELPRIVQARGKAPERAPQRAGPVFTTKRAAWMYAALVEEALGDRVLSAALRWHGLGPWLDTLMAEPDRLLHMMQVVDRVDLEAPRLPSSLRVYVIAGALREIARNLMLA